MRKLISINPAKNYKKLGSVTVSSLEEIKKKVALAKDVQREWKELGVRKRIELIKPIFLEFKRRSKELALLITKEIGKPIKESFDEVKFSEFYFKSFISDGVRYVSSEVSYEDDNFIHKIVYDPIGVAAVIVPWNFPIDMFIWGVIPNLIVGNTVVFPLTGKLIDEVMNKSRLPKGVFSEVYGDAEVGKMLVNQDIDLVWFTGSSKVGRRLYNIAGKKFIKAVLEMGGSNPAIVFQDVDVKQVSNDVYARRFLNCGQVCDAIKRLIVHKSIFNRVIESLKTIVESKVVGDPEDFKTDIGSLVSIKQLLYLESQVKDALRKGAKIVTGGNRPKNLKGAYYSPTILSNIKRNMRIWK